MADLVRVQTNEVMIGNHTTSTDGDDYADIKRYLEAGHGQMKAIMAVTAITGTQGTLNVKIQQDTTSAFSSATDLTPTFTEVTTAAGTEEIHFLPTERYVRAYATLAGTSPNFTFAVLLQGTLKDTQITTAG